MTIPKREKNLVDKKCSNPTFTTKLDNRRLKLLTDDKKKNISVLTVLSNLSSAYASLMFNVYRNV